ncbi:alpha/beta hydrolase [Shewanella sp. SW32]|uniref:alpha/beta hydrolase n=1 Tax=Shewanella sp. SW32 TaxID=2912817 RepID=UPI0021DAC0BD|nr:alpha/beta hydrolase [Shewanella sp. SW32]MCU7964497.1 alpha/beta hydrolase [Shewanella sp. SW32]
MATLLIVPGFGGSGPLHWQSWIAQKYESAIWVNNLPLLEPKIHIWANTICRAIDQIEGEILILAHSFGCLATSLAIARHPQRVAAAILVAPASPARFSENGHILPEHDGTKTIKHLLPKHIWTHPVCKTFDINFEKSSLHPYIRPLIEGFLWP